MSNLDEIIQLIYLLKDYYQDAMANEEHQRKRAPSINIDLRDNSIIDISSLKPFLDAANVKKQPYFAIQISKENIPPIAQNEFFMVQRTGNFNDRTYYLHPDINQRLLHIRFM